MSNNCKLCGIKCKYNLEKGFCLDCYRIRRCCYCYNVREFGFGDDWPMCDYCVRHFSYCKICLRSVKEDEIGISPELTLCKECK